jgi:hypothetical protein
MGTGTMLVSLIAALGWLFLNYRALQSHGLSGRQKAAMAIGWAVIIAGLAYALDQNGF